NPGTGVGLGNKNPIQLTGPGIARVRFEITQPFPGGDGFGIDDVSFLGPPNPYQYTVKAIDPDGDPLTYSLPLGPQGMSIDPTSGLITWAGPGVANPPSGPAPSDGLTLTSAGSAAGFAVTDFANGFPNLGGE